MISAVVLGAAAILVVAAMVILTVGRQSEERKR